MKNKILYLSILFMLISSIVVFSCSKSGSGSTTTTTPPPTVSNAVSIVNMSFSPATLTVTAGTTVTWTNNDGMTHTTTSDNTGFNSGNLTSGSKFSQLFSTVGTFAYHCNIHTGMKGTIVVK
jgi:plastocyanin